MKSSTRASRLCAGWPLAILLLLAIAAYAMQTETAPQPASEPGTSHMGHMSHHAHEHHANVSLPPGDADRGAQVFQSKNCAKCHATQPDTKSFGPNLYGVFDAKVHGHRMTQGAVVYRIRHGGGKMPPYGSQITRQQLADVVAYLKSLRPANSQ